MRKPRDGIDATPVKDATGTPPATRGSLQWFQKKQQRWKQSPRGCIVALPPSPALQQNSSASFTKNSILKQSTSSVSKASSFSSTSPAPSGFAFPATNASSSAPTTTTTPKSLFPPNPSGTTIGSPFAKPDSGFSFPASAALKPPLGASLFQQHSTPSISFGASTRTNNVNAPTGAGFGSSKSAATTSTATFTSFGTQSGATTNSNINTFGAAPKREPPPVAVPPATAPAKEDKNLNHRERLFQFYKTYNPSKIDTVDATLANYKGKEELLFRKLEEKYVSGKDGMLPPSGTGPTCYLDLSIDDGIASSSGRVTVKLYQDKAPLACENFRCLCTGEKGTGRSTKELCYRGSRVHRIVPNFVVQMGDFTKGDGTGGESIYPPNSEHGDMWGKFKDETPFLMHARKGLLSMANNGPNKNGSQFFITLKAIPHLDGKHVVFGEVVGGMEIVEKMGQLETDKKQRPLASVTIQGCGQLRDDGNGVNKADVNSQASASTSQQPFGFGTAPTVTFGGVFAANKAASQQSPFVAPGKDPTPFGAAAEPASGSSFAFPPMATKAPTPFGEAAKPALGGSSAFPPMATKAPTPFGAKPSPGSSMSLTSPSTPFAAFSSQNNTKSPGQGFTAPSSSVFGKAINATAQKQQGQSPFSFGAAEAPVAQTTRQSKNQTEPKSTFSFGAPCQDNRGVTTTFSFGKVAESDDHTKNDMSSSEAPKPAFSFGAPKSTPDTSPAPPSSSFGNSAATQIDKPSSSASTFSFGVPTVEGGGQPQPKGSMSATKPTLPSFYFGQEKTGVVPSGTSKALDKTAEAKVDESKETSVPETSSEQSKSREIISTKLDDVSFASFSPNFMHRSEDIEKSKVDDKASTLTHSSKDTDQTNKTCEAASNSSRGDMGGGEASTSTEDAPHTADPEDASYAENPDMMSTPAKPKNGDNFFQGGKLETITPKQKNTTATTANTRLWMTEAKPPRPKGMQRGFYSTPSRKQPRDISEAVADILAERVFSDDVVSEVSVEAVEKVMALPVEMMIAVLEHIDQIESRGETFTWNDIQTAIQENQGTVKALNFDDQSFASFDDFKSCVSRLTAASGKLPISASQEDDDDLSCSSSARETGDRSQFGVQQKMSSESKEGEEEEEDIELLIQNLEFLN